MHAGDGVTSDAGRDAETMQVNAVAAVCILGLAANYFGAARRGHLAAISSIAGDRGRKGNPAYNASKAALTTFLEGLRNRLFPLGVTVSTVKPGFLDTRMLDGRKGLLWVVARRRGGADDRRPPGEASRGLLRAPPLGPSRSRAPSRAARSVFKRIGPP